MAPKAPERSMAVGPCFLDAALLLLPGCACNRPAGCPLTRHHPIFISNHHGKLNTVSCTILPREAGAVRGTSSLPSGSVLID